MDPDQLSVDDTFEQRKVLLEEGRLAFDRFFTGSINQILSKIYTLFQIFLVIVTIQIPIVGFKISSMSSLSYIVLLANFIVIVITFAVFYEQILPKPYAHVVVFEDDKYKDLCGLNKTQLVDHFLKETRKAHLKNKSIFNDLLKKYKLSLRLIVVYLMLFIALIMILY
jgi:hypothetical protein